MLRYIQLTQQINTQKLWYIETALNILEKYGDKACKEFMREDTVYMEHAFIKRDNPKVAYLSINYVIDLRKIVHKLRELRNTTRTQMLLLNSEKANLNKYSLRTLRQFNEVIKSCASYAVVPQTVCKIYQASGFRKYLKEVSRRQRRIENGHKVIPLSIPQVNRMSRSFTSTFEDILAVLRTSYHAAWYNDIPTCKKLMNSSFTRNLDDESRAIAVKLASILEPVLVKADECAQCILDTVRGTDKYSFGELCIKNVKSKDLIDIRLRPLNFLDIKDAPLTNMRLTIETLAKYVRTNRGELPAIIRYFTASYKNDFEEYNNNITLIPLDELFESREERIQNDYHRVLYGNCKVISYN